MFPLDVGFETANLAIDTWALATSLCLPGKAQIVQLPPHSEPVLDFEIKNVVVQCREISSFTRMWSFDEPFSGSKQNLAIVNHDSGYQATAMRDLAMALMPYFHVHIVGAVDPRWVSLEHGSHDLGTSAGDLVRASAHFPGAIWVGPSEAGNRIIVAAAHMFQSGELHPEENRPKGLVVMGSPFKPTAEHSTLSHIASYGWGAGHLFSRVRDQRFPGVGREILPPEAQIDRLNLCCPVPENIGQPKQALPAEQISQRLKWIFYEDLLGQGKYYFEDQRILPRGQLVIPGAIGCPVQIIVGEKDRTVCPGQTLALKQHIAGVDDHIIPDATHWDLVTGEIMRREVVPRIVQFGGGDPVQELKRLVA